MSSLRMRLRTVLDRLNRLGHRKRTEFRRWLEDTRNFIHLSLLFVLPLLIGLVTFLSNTVDLLPFLLFPPLASGGYSLFADPESKSASPRRFVGGMTAGAVCGWVALELAAGYWFQAPPEIFHVHPLAASFGVLLTMVVTWLLDFEESQAFSTALLVLVVGVTQFVYVLSIFASSALVAGVFLLWRREVYEQRADYLYQTTHGDDHVLVPMRGDTADRVASFGAQLAAPHEAGKLVLLEVTDPGAATAERAVVEVESGTSSNLTDVSDPIARLESRAAELSNRFDIPCEVVVVTGDGDDARTVERAARELNCDLIVTAYESENGKLSGFVRGLFATSLDVVAVRLEGGQPEWNRIMVPIGRPGDVANAMLDFADRLAGENGHAAACHCIESEQERHEAEEMIVNVSEAFDRTFETRVANIPIETFLSMNAEHYDLTIVGSSTERTRVSRFIDPPTFRQLDDLDCDLAIVHRG